MCPIYYNHDQSYSPHMLYCQHIQFKQGFFFLNPDFTECKNIRSVILLIALNNDNFKTLKAAGKCRLKVF